MVRPHVREVAEREGIRNALELSHRSGVPYASVYGLWHGTAKMISFATLDRLCAALGCRPGQLFDYTPEPDKLPRPDEADGRTGARKARRVKLARPQRQARKAAPVGGAAAG
ncbi:MAG TPA: helix-turn-helix transcriptional regulator [Blastocatellia bacterium]|nr:helix-turn-helix transcriptional regulator [Blastocatellia bacterium]